MVSNTEVSLKRNNSKFGLEKEGKLENGVVCKAQDISCHVVFVAYGQIHGHGHEPSHHHHRSRRCAS